MAYLDYFPPVIQQLQEEINLHPKLVNIIETEKANGSIRETLDVLLHVAAYAGIEVDGVFNEQELLSLCELCRKRLEKMR